MAVQDVSLAAILAGTVLALYLRPFGASDWQVAACGAVLAWAIGPLGVDEGARVLADSANIIAFFCGLMLLAAGAEAAGLYARAAQLLRRAPTVPGRTALVLAAAFAITAVLSNDATPLVLTPAIIAAAPWDAPLARRPAYAATFMADGASLLLPVSNPVNLLFYEQFHLSFGHYLTTVSVAAAAGAAAMAAVTLLQWRGSPGRSAVRTPPEHAQTPAAPRSGRLALAVIVALAVAYVVAGLIGFPLGAVTLGGGVALLAAARFDGPVDLARYRKHLAPGVLVFVASLLLLVESVQRAGLLGGVGDALHWLEQGPVILAILGSALIAAVLANLLNNWPSALLLAAAIAARPGDHDALVMGTLIGSTIGANFTVVGSLSTVFWLSLNRKGGHGVSAREYAYAAALPTTAGVLAACLVAALVM